MLITGSRVIREGEDQINSVLTFYALFAASIFQNRGSKKKAQLSKATDQLRNEEVFDGK